MIGEIIPNAVNRVILYHPDYSVEEIAEREKLTLGSAKLAVRIAISTRGAATRAGALVQALVNGEVQIEQIIRKE